MVGKEDRVGKPTGEWHTRRAASVSGAKHLVKLLRPFASICAPVAEFSDRANEAVDCEIVIRVFVDLDVLPESLNIASEECAS